VVRGLLVAAVLAGGLAGCGRAHPRPHPGPRPRPQPAAEPSTTAPAAPIAWSACPGHAGWDCGTLSVPLDHANPALGDITLALDRHRATSHRLGSLLVNPGGPGASGVEWAFDALAAQALDPVLVRDFDIVGFDPRGVGASTPVECVDGATLDRFNHLDPAPVTAAGVDALVSGYRQLAAGCAARSGRLLAHVSTVDAARDMDAIRAALGDPKLTYLGFSYGTLLGATYASLFPGRVRALVLDGALDPALDAAAVTTQQAVGFEQELDDFLADCAANARSCAFHRDGAPTLRAAFDRVVAGIADHPIRGSGTRTVGPAEAALGILWPLYDRTQWPVLAGALAAAQQGDGSVLLAENDAYLGRHADGTYDNEEVANTAVDCLDRPASTLADVEAQVAADRRVAPYFGPLLAWSNLGCLYWPVPATGRVGPLHAPGAPPVLVVGSTGDPVTRYAWARDLARELGSGVLVTRHGEGHTGYRSSQCVRDLVDSYLVSLAVPTPAAADCGS
jgi:pimeloyl-ACP methyl ester carboxylesterase